MTYRYHGRAEVNPQRPRAFGICDRCGFLYNLHKLRWQYDFAGPVLQNLRFLVCDLCYDKAQEQKKPVLLPPDPLPVANARIINYKDAETDWRITQDGNLRVAQNDELRVVQSSQWNTYTTVTTSGDGTFATVTFVGGTIIPGTTVTITGVAPAGYNGDFVVTNSSAGSISFLSPITGAQTVAGTIIVPLTRVLTSG